MSIVKSHTAESFGPVDTCSKVAHMHLCKNAARIAMRGVQVPQSRLYNAAAAVQCSRVAWHTGHHCIVYLNLRACITAVHMSFSFEAESFSLNSCSTAARWLLAAVVALAPVQLSSSQLKCAVQEVLF